MWHRFALLVVFALAALARPAVADILTGGGLVTPVRPHLQGLGSLFQSPPPPVLPGAGNAPVTVTPVVPVAPAKQAWAAGAVPPGAMCRAAISAAEARHGIPTGLLLGIGVVESGRREGADGARQPWPWTINAEGEGRYFDSKEQAVAWVRAARGRGVRSIDTGCMQVNMLHHPAAFASLEQAFDPAANADYAARFLRELRDGPAGGNWLRAVGYYHSQTPELAEPYRRQVLAALAGRDPAGGPAAPSVAVAAAPAFPATPPAIAPAPARLGEARVIAAPAGGTGRDLDAYRAAPILLAARATAPAIAAVTGR